MSESERKFRVFLSEIEAHLSDNDISDKAKLNWIGQACKDLRNQPGLEKSCGQCIGGIITVAEHGACEDCHKQDYIDRHISNYSDNED